MPTPTSTHAGATARHRPLPPWARLLLGAGGLAAAAFAVTAIEYATALAAGSTPWINQWLAWAVAADFVHGPRATTQYMVAHYRAALAGIGPHMVAGGLAGGLGVLQFVPALRRRHPGLHRATGALVVLATLASMAGAVAFLVHVPMREGASGPAFHLGLWALSGLTLFLLCQAALAAWARDFRAHMVWMALTYAALATAPMLRLGWALLGNVTTQTHEAVNMATGTLVLVQTVLVMSLWLQFVGDRDLPARTAAPQSAWPPALVAMLSLLALLALVHDAVLAWLGLDLHAARRTAADRPGAAVLLWAAGAAAVLFMLPRAWQAALRGARPGTALSTAVLLAAAGALLYGALHDTTSMTRYAAHIFWIGLGATLVFALAMAHFSAPASNGRNAWLLWLLALFWLPAAVAPMVGAHLLLGIGFDEAWAAALVNGGGGLLVAGVATGYGARLRWRAVPALRKAAA